MDNTLTPSDNESRSKGKYNRAAIKRQFIKVSDAVRAGKFTRVSESSVDDVIAEIEAKFRSLRDRTVSSPMGQVDPDEANDFLTGEGEQVLYEAFRIWIAREIHAKVNNVRTGKTL